MTAFTVEQIAPLQLVRTSPLAEMYTLSPFVWREQGPVVARGDDPLITPPPGAPGDTDIAFAASAIEGTNRIYLYYSIADRAMMRTG
jgi:hypothetical protein